MAGPVPGGKARAKASEARISTNPRVATSQLSSIVRCMSVSKTKSLPALASASVTLALPSPPTTITLSLVSPVGMPAALVLALSLSSEVNHVTNNCRHAVLRTLVITVLTLIRRPNKQMVGTRFQKGFSALQGAQSTIQRLGILSPALLSILPFASFLQGLATGRSRCLCLALSFSVTLSRSLSLSQSLFLAPTAG